MINIRKLLVIINLTMVECACYTTCNNILAYSRNIMNQVNVNYNMLYSIRRDVDKMINLPPPPTFPYPPFGPPSPPLPPFGPPLLPSLPPNTPQPNMYNRYIMYTLIILIILIIMIVIIIRILPYILCCYIIQQNEKCTDITDMV